MPSNVLIHVDTYRKIFNYARLADVDKNECIGLLSIAELPSGGLLIDDALLPKQFVSGASCEIDKKDTKVICDYPHPEKLKGWWHSHRSMGSFHSNTDDETLWAWGGPNSVYSVSLVVSLPSEMKFWIKMFKPVELEKVELPVTIVFGDEQALLEQCTKEFKERVSEKSYTNSDSKNFQDLDQYGSYGVQPWKNDKWANDSDEETPKKSQSKNSHTVETLPDCLHIMHGRNGPYCHIHGKFTPQSCEECKRRVSKQAGSEIKYFLSCKHFNGYVFNEGTNCKLHGAHADCTKCKDAPVKLCKSTNIKLTDCKYSDKIRVVNGVLGCETFNQWTACEYCGLDKAEAGEIVSGGSQ